MKLVIITIICLLVILGGITLTIIGIMHSTQVDILEEWVAEQTPTIAENVLVYMPPSYELRLFTSYPVIYVFADERVLGPVAPDDQQWNFIETLDDLFIREDYAEAVVVSVYASDQIEDDVVSLMSKLDPYIRQNYRINEGYEMLVEFERERPILEDEHFRNLVLPFVSSQKMNQ